MKISIERSSVPFHLGDRYMIMVRSKWEVETDYPQFTKYAILETQYKEKLKYFSGVLYITHDIKELVKIIITSSYRNNDL